MPGQDHAPWGRKEDGGNRPVRRDDHAPEHGPPHGEYDSPGALGHRHAGLLRPAEVAAKHRARACA